MQRLCLLSGCLAGPCLVSVALGRPYERVHRGPVERVDKVNCCTVGRLLGVNRIGLGDKVTRELEGGLVVLNEVDDLYLAGVLELEADVMVVAVVFETRGFLRQVVVTLGGIPCAVGGQLQGVIGVCLQGEFERIFL